MDPPPYLRLPLRDGTPVGLRPVVREDAGQLLEGFDALSPRSRRFRFLSHLSHLSPEQTQYLTDVDHVNHVAWGALDLSGPEPAGVGIGRMVRLPEASGVAEFSLTVLDSAQGRGLGSLLLALLTVLARPLGIRVLRGYVARDNTRMVEWLLRLGARSSDEGGDLVLDLPTSPARWPPEAADFREDAERIRAAARAWEHPLSARLSE